MSDLTVQQALDLLQASPTQFNSLEALYNLASRVHVDSVGDVTILYGGQPANGITPQEIFDAMKLNGDSIRILDDTDAAKFLGSDEFRVALASVYGLSRDDLEAQPASLSLDKQQALKAMDDSLFHATDGPWAQASGRFVDATVGEIRTLTGGASPDRTFAQVEIPRALANQNITHIDGIARSDLVEAGTTNAFNAIRAQSDVYSAELKLAVNADGTVFKAPDGQIRLDSQNFFDATGLQGKPPLVDVGNYKHLAEFMPDRLNLHAAGVDVLQDIGSKYEAIRNWFYEGQGLYRIERLEFADGSSMDHAALAQLALTTSNTGTAGNDTLGGTAFYSERLIGGDGNDTLTAVGNNDVLEGGAGNDVLTNSSPSNQKGVYIGGTGNDTITGSNHADTYIFNRGDGSDTITDVGPSSTTDKLVFGEGIADQDLWFSRSGNHLLVQVLGDDGQVQVNNWYGSANNRIEEMHLSDGQRLLYAQVDALVQAMAAFAPPAPGQTTLTPEQQSALAPVIAASWG